MMLAAARVVLNLAGLALVIASFYFSARDEDGWSTALLAAATGCLVLTWALK
jgi:hypothetical protein